MTNETEVKLKKPIWKKWWFWLIAIFVIIIIASAGGGGKKETQEQSQIPFSQQEVTENSVRGTLKNLDLSDFTLIDFPEDITKIDVIDRPSTPEVGDKRVVVYYKSKFWSDKKTMEDAVQTAIQTMEVLFKNPKVAEVIMRQQADFTDKYGETTTDLAVRIAMDKKTADKIVNWEQVGRRARNDYNNFFDVAELQYVHPAISKGL